MSPGIRRESGPEHRARLRLGLLGLRCIGVAAPDSQELRAGLAHLPELWGCPQLHGFKSCHHGFCEQACARAVSPYFRLRCLELG